MRPRWYTGHRDRGYLDLFGKLEFLSLAHHGHSKRKCTPGDDRDAVLFPAEHAMGPGDGLCDVDHLADASALYGLPESLHHQYHFQRSQRLGHQMREVTCDIGQIGDKDGPRE